MIFWVVALAAAAAVAILVARPLFAGRRAAAPRAAHDMQVFRDQLAALDRDVERGVIPPSESEGARAEISRRLLAAAEEAERAPGAGPAPGGTSRLAALGVVAAATAGAAALYLTLGAPGAPDLPLQERLAALQEQARDRASQAEAERELAENAPESAAAAPDTPETAQMRALVERLKKVLEDRPDDVRGHRLLADSLRRLGAFPEALAAQRKLMALLGESAEADDYATTGELMILAVNGYVSPEAEDMLKAALTRDPTHASARFYAGLALAQNGRPDLALPLWAQLVRDGPADAPWIPMVRAQIDELAAASGLPRPALPAPPASAAPGPSRDDVEAASRMTDDERREMIEGMVSRLGERLAEEGGPPEDWARLVSALGVLGRTAQAREILDEARGHFAGDAAAEAALDDAARRAGLER